MKRNKSPTLSRSETPTDGIPFHLEKLTEVIPVKVGCNLKHAIPKPQSSWIRKAVIARLERERKAGS